MRFGPHLLDEILRRTDLVQLVGRRVKLTRKGQAFWGCCPFHQEKSPSFKVENARRTYKCFGCGKGGDAFRWLTETEGLSFPEAVERLAGEAGVELPKWTPEEEEREEKKKSLYDVIEAACVFFEAQLLAKAGSEAREYLKSRGLDFDAARKFRLGYAPDSNNALIGHLTTKNVTMDAMIAAGLVRPANEERGPRDFFFDRLMFPIADARGRVVAFGGRGLTADAKPKYINTGETELFSKGHLLYNFATARAAAIKAQNIVVAEGYMDVIALVRAGFAHAVAPLGTALTEDQLHLLWRTAPEPTMAFDGDAAGLKAAQRAARLALPHLKAGFSLCFAFLPAGEDPDSLLRGGGPAAMKKVLDEALPLSQVLWRGETEGRDFSTPERRAGLERSLGEIVAAIGDAKIADYYRRDFEQKVFDAFKRRPAVPARRDWQPGPRRWDKGQAFQKPKPQPGTAEAVSPQVRASSIARSSAPGVEHAEQELLYRIVRNPELLEEFLETIVEVAPSSPAVASALHAVIDLYTHGKARSSREILDHLVQSGHESLVRKFETGDSYVFILPKDAGPELAREALRFSLQQQFELQGPANENGRRPKPPKFGTERRQWKGPLAE